MPVSHELGTLPAKQISERYSSDVANDTKISMLYRCADSRPISHAITLSYVRYRKKRQYSRADIAALSDRYRMRYRTDIQIVAYLRYSARYRSDIGRPTRLQLLASIQIKMWRVQSVPASAPFFPLPSLPFCFHFRPPSLLPLYIQGGPKSGFLL